MAMIYITCPDCTAHNPMPARAMLATLDLGEVLGPLGQLSLGLPQGQLDSARAARDRGVRPATRRTTGGCS
jgi:hypothetical protein